MCDCDCVDGDKTCASVAHLSLLLQLLPKTSPERSHSRARCSLALLLSCSLALLLSCSLVDACNQHLFLFAHWYWFLAEERWSLLRS
jgi:hypothetical protein